MAFIEDEPLLPENRTLVEGKESAVYSRDAYFPDQNLGTTSSVQLRDYKMVKVIVFPYQYNRVVA